MNSFSTDATPDDVLSRMLWYAMDSGKAYYLFKLVCKRFKRLVEAFPPESTRVHLDMSSLIGLLMTHGCDIEIVAEGRQLRIMRIHPDPYIGGHIDIEANGSFRYKIEEWACKVDTYRYNKTIAPPSIGYCGGCVRTSRVDVILRCAPGPGRTCGYEWTPRPGKPNIWHPVCHLNSFSLAKPEPIYDILSAHTINCTCATKEPCPPKISASRPYWELPRLIRAYLDKLKPDKETTFEETTALHKDAEGKICRPGSPLYTMLLDNSPVFRVRVGTKKNVSTRTVQISWDIIESKLDDPELKKEMFWKGQYI